MFVFLSMLRGLRRAAYSWGEAVRFSVAELVWRRGPDLRDLRNRYDHRSDHQDRQAVLECDFGDDPAARYTGLHGRSVTRSGGNGQCVCAVRQLVAVVVLAVPVERVRTGCGRARAGV